ncbi:MAG: D-aminoacyl-tRNA deacylase [Desulfurivibrionaceae bacterium]|nr:D-aminoacyl-tRNA deacylase [Desulfobulbales bacterium]MDT8335109.1 D-aminoacyl-tRNA deacylase [Desulfurivibrionaceae bacterium]
MRAVVQRVSECRVTAGGETTGEIGEGLLVLLGVSADDSERDADYLADKIANLRIFPDDNDKMNLSVKDVGGEVLTVSQFTLFGDCRKGRRPSYNDAAPPEQAEKLYGYFVGKMAARGLKTATGRFQAMMAVSLTNEGPVTILLDSEKKF